MFNASLNNNSRDVVGSFALYGGSTAPSGWLICDGSALSRTLYAELFSVIGTTYGAGDGSTTFNIPSRNGVCNTVVAKATANGNGKSLGLTDGTNNGGIQIATQGGYTGWLYANPSFYNADVGTTQQLSGSMINDKVAGLTTDPAKSGIEVNITRSILPCKILIKY